MAYPRYGLVSRLLPDYEAQVLASSFGERVGLTVRLPEEQFEELRAALTEATAARWRPNSCRRSLRRSERRGPFALFAAKKREVCRNREIARNYANREGIILFSQYNISSTPG